MTSVRSRPAQLSGNRASGYAGTRAEGETFEGPFQSGTGYNVGRDWRGPAENHFRAKDAILVNRGGWEPVCGRSPESSRETANLHFGMFRVNVSGWPSSEPCKAGADGRLLQCDPSACETCSADAPLSRNCPKRYRRRSCASEGWGVREVLLRHRRVDRVELPKRAPFSRAFRWPEPYGHSQHAIYSSEEVPFVFRYPLESIFFLRAAREDGRL